MNCFLKTFHYCLCSSGCTGVELTGRNSAVKAPERDDVPEFCWPSGLSGLCCLSSREIADWATPRTIFTVFQVASLLASPCVLLRPWDIPPLR